VCLTSVSKKRERRGRYAARIILGWRVKQCMTVPKAQEKSSSSPHQEGRTMPALTSCVQRLSRAAEANGVSVDKIDHERAERAYLC
jgi:hypothetical protein